MKNSTMCIKVLFISIQKKVPQMALIFFPHLVPLFIYKLFITSSAHVMSKVCSVTGSTMFVSYRPRGFYSTIQVRFLISPLSFINLTQLHGIPVHAIFLKSIHSIAIIPKVRKAPCEMRRAI